MDSSNAGGKVSSRYPASANGVLTREGLRLACGHVWRDSNSIVMLGANILNSEPVSYDDKQAFAALKRHIEAAGPRAFVEDVLPNLGFGPVVHASEPNATPCAICGKEAVPLHPGCRLCEDCCDHRPSDEA